MSKRASKRDRTSKTPDAPNRRQKSGTSSTHAESSSLAQVTSSMGSVSLTATSGAREGLQYDDDAEDYHQHPAPLQASRYNTYPANLDAYNNQRPSPMEPPVQGTSPANPYAQDTVILVSQSAAAAHNSMKNMQQQLPVINPWFEPRQPADQQPVHASYGASQGGPSTGHPDTAVLHDPSGPPPSVDQAEPVYTITETADGTFKCDECSKEYSTRRAAQ